MTLGNDNGIFTNGGLKPDEEEGKSRVYPRERVPYTSPAALCDETRNKLVSMAQEAANKNKCPQEVWCWNITSDACSFDICSVGDPEILYSQDPSTFLLITVHPIPAPIYPPLKGNIK